jgi:hypothetical protein
VKKLNLGSYPMIGLFFLPFGQKELQAASYKLQVALFNL